MNLTEEERQKLNEELRRHCDQLSEHFDSVQIFVTTGEMRGFRGAGNFAARYGQVALWFEYHKAQEQIDAQKDYERFNGQVD